jgi:O-antigen/teichoic acid export membrane protein
MIARLFKSGAAKNYSFSFFGNMFSAASQWVVMMLLSKLYGTTQMGYYALAMAWILPLFAFFSLQIRNIHVSDQAGVYGFNVFFKIRVVCAFIFFLTIAAIGYIFYRHIFTIFLLGGLFKSFEMMSDMIHAEFHKRKRIEVYGKMLMFRSVLSITLNFILFSTIKSFQLALISMPLAYLCSMLVDFRLLHGLKMNVTFKTDNKLVKKFIATGILTGLSLLLVYLLPNIPRFILEKYRSSFELGLFSGYLSLIIFTRIFVQSVVQNSLPYLAQYYDEGNYTKFLSVLKKEAMIISGLGLAQFVLIPFSDLFFPLLFNKDFSGNHLLLAIVFTGSVFSFLGFVLNNAVNAMKILKVQLPVYAALVALSFILGFLLIPKFGLIGAGWVFLIVNFFTCAMLFSMIAMKIRKMRPADTTTDMASELATYKVANE